MKKPWNRILIIFIALAALAALFFFASKRAALRADRDAFLSHLQAISTEQIGSASATDWNSQVKISLSTEQLEQVLQLLQSLPPDSILEHDGLAGTGQLSLFLNAADGSELLLKLEQDTVFFTTDEATAALWNGRSWKTVHPPLTDYLNALFSALE